MTFSISWWLPGIMQSITTGNISFSLRLCEFPQMCFVFLFSCTLLLLKFPFNTMHATFGSLNVLSPVCCPRLGLNTRHIFCVEHEEDGEREWHNMQGWQYCHIHLVLHTYKSPAVLKGYPRNTVFNVLKPWPSTPRWLFLAFLFKIESMRSPYMLFKEIPFKKKCK